MSLDSFFGGKAPPKPNVIKPAKKKATKKRAKKGAKKAKPAAKEIVAVAVGPLWKFALQCTNKECKAAITRTSASAVPDPAWLACARCGSPMAQAPPPKKAKPRKGKKGEAPAAAEEES